MPVAAEPEFCHSRRPEFLEVLMSIGPWQIAIILVIMVIFFGRGKLPGLASDMAQAIKNFRTGMKGESQDKASSESSADAKSEKS